MTPIPLEALIAAALYAAALIAILWLSIEARPRGKKDRGADHVHQGTVRSRHEVGGVPIAVVECAQCQCHFNVVGV